MGLIMYGGNVKSDVMEVIVVVKLGDFELVDKKIVDVEELFVYVYYL